MVCVQRCDTAAQLLLDTTYCGGREPGTDIKWSHSSGWVPQLTEGLAECAGISRCSLTSW